MPEFVVLLRGVNVGNSNRLAMAKIRLLLDSLGYWGVRARLDSANAVLEGSARSSQKHAKVIAAALKDQVALDTAVVVLSEKAFADVIKDNPDQVGDDMYLKSFVAFPEQLVGLEGLSALSPLVRDEESFEIGKHAAYLQCSLGIKGSKAANALLGRLGKSVMNRNWATVLKLKGLLPNGTA
jgi:uncharacterized protein (DUF1697 family)